MIGGVIVITDCVAYCWKWGVYK